ncbi:hypothetical protein KC19_4G037300 [Ceratodon purpureus]|uniref:Hexosyltransferase n=1 Tax=Ceratodon purpureus TaxID=3225 RepID=A0A8T0I4W1_CERPU|nr:hypothetical protein KC19_4G037300 [Ceratodon purpureus]
MSTRVNCRVYEMRKPLLSLLSSRKNLSFGCIATVLLAVSFGALLYTCLLLSPAFLQGATRVYSRASASAPIVCDCSAERRLDGYSATLTPGATSNGKLSILLGVLTMASKVERRNIIRLAYGVQHTEYADVTLRFVIGKPKSDEERLAVGLELLQYGDIIILDCEENMNHGKSFTFFDTVATMGIHYDYVMKLDDDSYVRTENLAKSLSPLSRTDLYYGYVLPCENQDPYSWYMAGMGYVISWDLVEWVHESPIARNNTDGTEDQLMGEWLKAGGKAKNRVSKKPLFYDHPDFGGKCAHELIPETILVHQVKNDKRWFEILSFFEGGRIGDVIASTTARQSS